MMKNLCSIFILVCLIFCNTNAQTSVCGGDTVILKGTNYIEGELQWQESIDSINWINIAGATQLVHQLIPTHDAYYRLKITNENCNPPVTFTPVEAVIITMNDIDGNIYNTVKIGNQCWMAENLRTSRYANGDQILYITNELDWVVLVQTESGAWVNYDNDSQYDSILGKLYNWYAVDDLRGLCPEGWHVPSDAEWFKMEKYVDSSINDSTVTGWRGTDGGIKLKAVSGWSLDGNGTNEFGFAGLPGGYRSTSGNFFNNGYNGFWWSSTEDNINAAWRRNLYFNYDLVERNLSNKSRGVSVRCLRD